MVAFQKPTTVQGKVRANSTRNTITATDSGGPAGETGSSARAAAATIAAIVAHASSAKKNLRKIISEWGVTR